MQQRSIPWLWLAIAIVLLLAPGPAGRLLIDVLGGLTLTVLLLPLVLAALGWVGWKILQSRLKTCQVCGFSSVGGEMCPACGTPYATDGAGDSSVAEIDAREVIIDVQATEVGQGSSAKGANGA